MLNEYFSQAKSRVSIAHIQLSVLVWALDSMGAVNRASWKLPRGYEVTMVTVEQHTNPMLLDAARSSPKFMEHVDRSSDKERLFTVTINADIIIEFPLPQLAYGEPDQSYATASSEGGELLSSPPSDPMQAGETD